VLVEEQAGARTALKAVAVLVDLGRDQGELVGIRVAIAVSVGPGKARVHPPAVVLLRILAQPGDGPQPAGRQFFKGMPLLVRSQIDPAEHGQRAQLACGLVHAEDQSSVGVRPEAEFAAAVAIEVATEGMDAPRHLVVAHQQRMEFLVPAIRASRLPCPAGPIHFDLHQPAPLGIHPDEVGVVRFGLGVGVELLAAVPLAKQFALGVEMRGAPRCGKGFDDHKATLPLETGISSVLAGSPESEVGPMPWSVRMGSINRWLIAPLPSLR